MPKGNDSKSESSSTNKTAQVAKKTAKKSNVSTEFNNSLIKAESYSSMMHMSKQGIYDQLSSDAGEKFTADEANYAMQHIND